MFLMEIVKMCEKSEKEFHRMFRAINNFGMNWENNFNCQKILYSKSLKLKSYTFERSEFPNKLHIFPVAKCIRCCLGVQTLETSIKEFELFQKMTPTLAEVRYKSLG